MRAPLVLLAFLTVPLHAETSPAKLKSQTITLDQYVSKNWNTPSAGPQVQFKMVLLPPGQITLKSLEGKDKTHDIKPIWIMTTEVTWNQYDIFWMLLDIPVNQRRNVDALSRPSRPYSPPDAGWGRDGFPAMGITIQSARQFCVWVSRQTGRKFRLPTEAEWEYACCAGGDPTLLPVSDPKANRKRLDRIAWYEANSDGQTHDVAKKHPNAWGLYDMLGNVAEWVTTDDPNAQGGATAAGGSFQDEHQDLTPEKRENYAPTWQRSDPQVPKGKGWLSDGHHIGLRLVMEE